MKNARNLYINKLLYSYYKTNIHILKYINFHLKIELIFKIIGSFLTTILNYKIDKKVLEFLPDSCKN